MAGPGPGPATADLYGPTDEEIAAAVTVVLDVLRPAEMPVRPGRTRRIDWGHAAFIGPRSWRRAAG
jgi:hypothetical protein